MNKQFYRLYNDDVFCLNDVELESHFENYGKNQNRVYDARTFSIKYFNNDTDFNDENMEKVFLSPIIVDLVKTKKNTDKLQILIFSNCQGHHFSLISKLNIFNKYFNFTLIANYIELTDETRNKLEIIFNNLDILIYQPIRESGIGIHLKYVLDNINISRVKTITLTYLYCNWYWLFEPKSFDILNKYKNLDIKKKDIHNILCNFDGQIIKNRMEESFKIFEEKEKDVDIKILSYIKQNYKKQRLFFNKNHVTKHIIIYMLNEFFKILKIDIELKNTFDLGIYNSCVFLPISSYIKKILELEFQEDSMGDEFYINYFNDFINNKDLNHLLNTYELNVNSEIYIKDRL